MRVLKEVRQYLRNYHLKAGIFHFYRGEFGPAAEFLTRAITEGTQLTSADRRSGEYYLVQTRIAAAAALETDGKLDDAMEEYRAALAVMPAYADVHIRLGQALISQNRLDDAIEHFRRAAFINPGFDEAHLRLGFALLTRGETAAAKDSFRAAQRAREEHARRQVAAAEDALGEERVEEARELYLDAFRQGMEPFRRHFEAGLAHLMDENWDDAADELAAAERIFPRFADVHNYRGVALAEAGKLAEAAAEFQRSARINPAYLVAWLNLAFTAHAMGDLERAERAVREVLREEPDNTAALHLAEQLRSRNRPQGRRERTEQGDGS